MRTYDERNDRAARLILAGPGRRNRLLIDWARRYAARWSRSREGVNR